jgi:hypothetical protein
MDMKPIKSSDKRAQDILVAHIGAWTQAAVVSPPKITVCLTRSFHGFLTDPKDCIYPAKDKGPQDFSEQALNNIFYRDTMPDK